ncbi:MAG: hypothetical protein WCV90_08610 [Candidatus Woesearchaeota archaeon]
MGPREEYLRRKINISFFSDSVTDIPEGYDPDLQSIVDEATLKLYPLAAEAVKQSVRGIYGQKIPKYASKSLEELSKRETLVEVAEELERDANRKRSLFWARINGDPYRKASKLCSTHVNQLFLDEYWLASRNPEVKRIALEVFQFMEIMRRIDDRGITPPEEEKISLLYDTTEDPAQKLRMMEELLQLKLEDDGSLQFKKFAQIDDNYFSENGDIDQLHQRRRRAKYAVGLLINQGYHASALALATKAFPRDELISWALLERMEWKERPKNQVLNLVVEEGDLQYELSLPGTESGSIIAEVLKDPERKNKYSRRYSNHYVFSREFPEIFSVR